MKMSLATSEGESLLIIPECKFIIFPPAREASSDIEVILSWPQCMQHLKCHMRALIKNRGDTPKARGGSPS
eukprot:8079535-Karenia_brevis.AAC.1